MILPAEQLQAIRALIRTCGQQAQQRATEQFQVYEKGRDDYVTDVDRALDAQLTAGFTHLFPEDGIITEENRQSWQALSQNYRRFWLIDPLDGTDDFIQAKPHYSVMVGLLEANQPVAGWVYAPAFDHLYWGGRDWGLFQQVRGAAPEPLVPTPAKPLSKDFCPILLGYKDQRRYGDVIAERIPGAQFDCIGSFGLKVLRVVCGQAGLYLYLNGRVKLWDTTGPLAIAKAAGLVCCDLAGEPLQFSMDGAVDPATLAHRQPILIGWADYVEALRVPLREAIAVVKSF